VLKSTGHGSGTVDHRGSKLFNQLLAEPDTKASFDKRLKLIGDAIEREADPRRRPSSSYGVNLKQARIPAEEGVPFLMKWLDNKSEVVKRTAMRMLGVYGTEAKSAVPMLQQLMSGDPIRNVRDDAMLTLTKIEPKNAEIAAAILERLGAAGADDSTNRAVLQALIAVAPLVPRSAVPRIAKFQEHRWAEMGIYAHEAIGKILALERPTLEQLRKMEAIDWRNAPDQGYSIFATIAEAGNKAEFAVPLLVELLIADLPPYLECVTLETLGKVKTGNPKLISALLDRMMAKDPLVRGKAYQALMIVDLKEPASVRAVAKGLRHSDPRVRSESAALLRRWDETNKLTPAGHDEILAPLIETIKEANDELAAGNLSSCLLLLRGFGARAAPVAETLEKMYRSDAYFKKLGKPFAAYQRASLLEALANIGIPESARPLFLEALQKGPTNEADSGYAYTVSARAVAAFAEAKQVVPLLLPALKVKGKEREFSYVDWSRKGPDGRSTTARLEAIRALARIGPEASDALPLLREIADAEAGKPGSIELVIQGEARRAYNAIASKLDSNSGKAIQILPFVDGKKDLLHLDDRLQIKLALRLRNPRPQDVLKRLQQATHLIFTMDENVDTETPAWGSVQMHQTAAWSVMRQLATAPSVRGNWEQTAYGYRLAGQKKSPDKSAVKNSKTPFPPFVDDTDDPLPDDPRLQVKLTIVLHEPTVQDFLKLLQEATGLALTTEKVDATMPIFGSVNWSNTTAWQAMRSIADSQWVQGAWEKSADGYRLRGRAAPAPVRAATPAAAPDLTDAKPAAPRAPLRLVGILGGVLAIVLCLALAWQLWGRRKG
jgi:hypothetical protein